MTLAIEAAGVELRHVLAREPHRLDLVALAVARLDDEPAADDEALATLDAWAARVAAAGGPDGAAALTAVLGGELGLRGDDHGYDEPINSFLPRVLARRRGLPILLSLVYLEVARRAGVALRGLALPGHFVVAHAPGPGELVVLDPFAGGRRLALPELAAVVSRAGATLEPAMLAPAPSRVIAIRMLRNLAGSYQRRARRDKLRVVAAMWRTIDPDDPTPRHLIGADPASVDELN